MIKCTDISVSFPTMTERRLSALNNLSLEIKKTEFVTIIGPNGSGKSTLALSLSGLVPLDSGSIEIDGMDIEHLMNTGKIRDLIGIVFQNPDDQILTGFIDREIALGLEARGVSREMMIKRVNETLERFNLKKLNGLSPNQLSGGQKQKLALASILISEPQYLVLDETTSYLDPIERKKILSLLYKEFKNRSSNNFSIILITQYSREAAQSDRVIVMNNGAICADGPPEYIFTEKHDLLSAIGVDIPVEYRLKAAVPEMKISAGLFNYRINSI